MRVYWTERARHRLRLIHDHIADNAPLVAPQVTGRLIQRSQQIGATPLRWTSSPRVSRRRPARSAGAPLPHHLPNPPGSHRHHHHYALPATAAERSQGLTLHTVASSRHVVGQWTPCHKKFIRLDSLVPLCLTPKNIKRLALMVKSNSQNSSKI